VEAACVTCGLACVFRQPARKPLYGAGNAGDGNANTYWESQNNAFPQWLQVDLGASVSVNQAVLKLPPATAWATRTETLSVQGSTTGSNFSDLWPRGLHLQPGHGNTVTINFGATTTRYVRLNITANTGWPAGQMSELEVYGPATGDTRPPSAPTGPRLHPAGQRPDPADLERVDRQRRRHRLRHLRQRRAAHQRRRQRADLHRQPAGQRHGLVLRAGQGRGRQPVGEQQHGDPHRHRRHQAPTAPGNLAYTQPASGQIRLTWNASTDNVGVTGYDVYANGALRTSVGGHVLTYTDSSRTARRSPTT
jgi:hypothetical protein